MQQQSSVLLIDDGELDDVRSLLSEIGAETSEMRGGSIPEHVSPPRDLLVTTGRRARVAEGWPTPAGEPPHPIKIAVVTEDSITARRMLRLMGFDFLVRRPVHPEALRLLLMRCVFRGQERRRHPRSPVGCTVSYRHGLRRGTAILSELSLEGLRLLSTRPLSVGQALTVRVPGELLGGRSFSLRASVLRSDIRRSRRERRELDIALCIDPKDHEGRRHVEELLWTIAAGPPSLAEPVEEPATSESPVASPEEPAPLGEAAAEAGPGPTSASEPEPSTEPARKPPRRKTRPPKRWRERRRYSRASFEQKVVADSESATRILVGRDLSSGGMRVDPDPSLEQGQRLQLAIYGWADEAPLMVGASVTRNEGAYGVGLEFDLTEPGLSDRLERLISALPAVESLRDDEVGSMGTVVSRVISSD
jgi:hypothetical protein